jgi:hypothetical protein
MTGGSTGQDTEALRLMAQGAEGVFPKPYSLDKVCGLVHRLRAERKVAAVASSPAVTHCTAS